MAPLRNSAMLALLALLLAGRAAAQPLCTEWITDHGAVGNNDTINTQAFRAAVSAAAACRAARDP